MQNTRNITQRGILEIIESQGYRCALSGRQLEPGNAAGDHIIPVSRGGTNAPDNIQILDEEINGAKRAMTNDEFVAMCREVVAWADRGRE